jgi:hypothetical protein
MHVRREDMHICVSSLLKCKMHLHLRDSLGGHLHYATVEFEVQIYICIALLEIALELISGQKRRDGQHIKVDSILSPSADVHQNCTQLEA